MLRLTRLATLLTVYLIASPSHADDGFAMAGPFNADWHQLVVRGDAAKVLYEAMRDVPEYQVLRDDGTFFWTRQAERMGCSKSEQFAEPHFACVTFVQQDGTMTGGTLDPEFGSTARIGVSN